MAAVGRFRACIVGAWNKEKSMGIGTVARAPYGVAALLISLTVGLTGCQKDQPKVAVPPPVVRVATL